MDKRQFEVAKIMMERSDSYVRHFFMLLVSWFTFFITINWVTLGWIAKGMSESTVQYGKVGCVVGNIFTWHCILGVIVCIASIFYFNWAANRIKTVESEIYKFTETNYGSKATFPLAMYAGSTVLMILGVAPFIWIWQSIFEL